MEPEANTLRKQKTTGDVHAWEYALIGLVVGIIIGAVAMVLVIVNYASNRRCSTNWKRIS